MILACPNCSARFLIDSNAIGAQGRDVRCGRCGHTWASGPPPAEDLADTASSPMRAELRAAGIDIEDESPNVADPPRADQPDFQSEEGVSERQEAVLRAEERRRERIEGRRGGSGKRAAAGGAGRGGLPAVRKPRRRWSARLAWLLVVLVVIGLGGAASHYRNDIIASWPAAERLYAAVGLNGSPLGFGLELVIVNSDQADMEGTPTLTVTGRIDNKTDQPRDVPGLRASLFDERERELRHWTFPAPVDKLPANQSVDFKTELKDPPEDAVRLSIIFDESK